MKPCKGGRRNGKETRERSSDYFLITCDHSSTSPGVGEVGEVPVQKVGLLHHIADGLRFVQELRFKDCAYYGEEESANHRPVNNGPEDDSRPDEYQERSDSIL